jgi:hypothetical protein
VFDPLCESDVEVGKRVLDDVALVDGDAPLVYGEMQQDKDVSPSVEDHSHCIPLFELPVGAAEKGELLLWAVGLLPESGVASQVSTGGVPATEATLAVKYPEVVMLVEEGGKHFYPLNLGVEGMPSMETDVSLKQSIEFDTAIIGSNYKPSLCRPIRSHQFGR